MSYRRLRLRDARAVPRSRYFSSSHTSGLRIRFKKTSVLAPTHGAGSALQRLPFQLMYTADVLLALQSTPTLMISRKQVLISPITRTSISVEQTKSRSTIIEFI
ncbi:hypothetical protein BJ165DRAFT_856365 [Panaeolus papilionaceus]|nr:hypothetical protein BJ165DRAFT_856365 [Panaeolus papilionaceus]